MLFSHNTKSEHATNLFQFLINEKILILHFIKNGKNLLVIQFHSKKKEKNIRRYFFVSKNMAKILFFNSKNVKVLLNLKFTYVEK